MAPAGPPLPLSLHGMRLWEWKTWKERVREEKREREWERETYELVQEREFLSRMRVNDLEEKRRKRERETLSWESENIGEKKESAWREKGEKKKGEGERNIWMDSRERRGMRVNHLKKKKERKKERDVERDHKWEIERTKIWTG